MVRKQCRGGTSLISLFTPARRIEAARIVLVGVITFLFWRGLLPLPALIAGVAIGLFPLVKTGIRDLVHEHKVGTEIFVTVATLVALAGREYIAASVLMTIILIAEFIADLNTDRARASIRALIGSVPQSAIVRGVGGDRTVPIGELKAGDVVLVRAGERVPVDGTVAQGSGTVNEASITGEGIPIDKQPGASVLTGTVVESGALDVTAEHVGGDTLFARVIGLVERAESEQAPVQKLADRVAAWLIPVDFVFLIAVFLVTHDVRKIVTPMIFTSPAELGLAMPLVMIAAVARAARMGILVKGGLYLELLAKADTIVFDKTGTLTAGEPAVTEVIVHDSGLTENAVLTLAAAADRRSAHPLAKAVIDYAERSGIQAPEPTAFEAIQGRGVRATVNGQSILLGNPTLLREHAVVLPDSDDDASTVMYLAVDGRLAGEIRLADTVRHGARETIATLKQTGIKRVVMLSGDREAVARTVAGQLGIDEIRAELLPEDKVTAIAELKSGGHTVVMVGDGVNDAPALARADVGIAMGARGTQAALEAADIALMTDDLSRIVTARAIARRAYRTIQENLFVGVGVVHVLGITAALLGWIGPVQAAMLHLGPDVLVFVNSVKLLRVRIEEHV